MQPQYPQRVLDINAQIAAAGNKGYSPAPSTRSINTQVQNPPTTQNVPQDNINYGDWGNNILTMLKQYQQQGQTRLAGAQAESAGRGLSNLPSDLSGMNLSPSQILGFKQGESSALAPTIGGARQQISEAGNQISDVKSLLDEYKKQEEAGQKRATDLINVAIQSGATGLEELLRGSPDVFKKAGYSTKEFEAVLTGLKAKEQKDLAKQNKELTNYQQTQTFNGIVGKYNSSPLIQAVDRTPVLKDTIKNIRKDPSNGALQLNLAYSYVQALDTYQSSVREGELALVNSIDSKIGQFQNYVTKIQNGQIVRPEVAKQLADAAEQLVNTIDSAAARKAQSFKAQADVAGVGDMWTQYLGGFSPAYGGGTSGAGGVMIGGKSVPVGSVITNSKGQRGKVNADGTITPLQ